MLKTYEHGTQTDRPPLLIAHGLFGSGRNWGAVAKMLSQDRLVVTVDMRNHGESPWFDSHSYDDLAADLAEVIATRGGPMDVLGHSMGGKAAMVLSLRHPEAVARLIVADIAPVSYHHSQTHHIAAMRAVDLSAINRRSEALAQLETHVKERSLQAFFLQSLDVKNRRWRLNLDVLEAEMDKILGFPAMDGAFAGATLFLTGGLSDYVGQKDRPGIKALFPKARFARIPDTGHWLHADKPRAFADTVTAFVDAGRG